MPTRSKVIISSPIHFSAHAALLVVLAEQHRDEDLEYLLKVAKDDSKIGQHGLVRGGALKGR